MKMIKLLVILALLPLIGCVSVQGPVAMDPNYIRTVSGNVGVAMNPLPATNLYMPGADCLLCIAAAQATNSSLDNHAESLSAEELAQVKADLMQKLELSGVKIIELTETVDFSKMPKHSSKLENSFKRDLSAYGAQHGISHLLLIDIRQVGMLRTYSSYFPTSDPKGYVSGVAYLLDLSDNTYKWYRPLNIQRSAEGEWDEAPTFPGLTNAYYQAIEMAKAEILADFE